MNDWKKVKIGDLCSVTKGLTGIKKAIEGEYPIVTLAESRGTHNEYQFDCAAVIIPLVSSTGHGHASIKRVHYQEGKFALGSILCAVIPNDPSILNPKYLHIYLSCLKDELLVPLMHGAANVSLSISSIKTIEIALPPIEKQIQIIKLENQANRVKIGLMGKFNSQESSLKKIRLKILQDAISGELTKNWRAENPNIEPVNELLMRIQQEKKKLMKERKIKRGKPLLSIKINEIPFKLPEGWAAVAFGDFTISRDGDRNPISRVERLRKERIYDYYGASGIIDKIDGFTHDGVFLLIGEDGANLVAKSTPIAFVARGKIWVNNHAHVLQLNNDISLRYLEIYINVLDIKPYITGGFQPKLSQGKLNQIPIAIPPITEQEAIVTKVELLIQKCDLFARIIAENKKNVDLLSRVFLIDALKT